MPRRYLTLILGFIAFIALGLPDGMLGVAWPFMREELGQPLEASGLLVMALTLSVAVSGFFSSWLSRRLGIGRLLALSCLLTGSALVGYALFPHFYLLIVCASVIGLAAGATDATVNGYVAKNFSDRVMQWLHASFGIGITLGPVTMTLVLAANGPWQLGYQIHAMVQLILAVLFFVTAGLWITRSDEHRQVAAHEADRHVTSMPSSLTRLPVWLGMMAFFLYCGLEISVGLWSFSLLTDVRGLSAAQAGTWVSLYWAMFTVGRFAMGFITGRVSSHRTVQLGISVSVLATVLLAVGGSVWLSLLALALIGLAYGPIFPAMMSTTLQRVGARDFNNAMGLQISSAALGMMVLPGSIGLLASKTTLNAYPWALLAVTGLLWLIYQLANRISHDR
ncbi:MFS transporter [Reinekea blandensis]|nr:MFS transporter [Reinekea blandensis]